MYYRLYRFRLVVSAIVVLVMVTACLCLSLASAQPNIEGKVVLANLDRYDAFLRFGKTRREIKPKKASVLSPKQYPLTIEFWSGNTKVGWRKQAIPAAGYLRFKLQTRNLDAHRIEDGQDDPSRQTNA